MDIQTMCAAVRSICAYRGLLELPLMQTAVGLSEALARGDLRGGVEAYSALFYGLRRSGCRSLGEWLDGHLRYDEAPYPLLVERGGEDPALAEAARRDVEALSLLAGVDWLAELEALDRSTGGGLEAVLARLPAWEGDVPSAFEGLTESYRSHGVGLFARYRAFSWKEGELVPIADPDCADVEAMVGYEAQREEVIVNTRALLEGRGANDVLLYGDSGTGKSATVKSLLTVPGFDELRLIEVDKDRLTGMPTLIRLLSGRRQKFILFIDDLAFDRDDKTYSALKTILEGGLERRPANVAVYATSNRRRLVRQTVSERDGDEWDVKETIDEKTALSERFGLRVVYLPLDKRAYLELVDRLAAQEGVELAREELHREALKWEVYHPGRTPRTARQFLKSLHP